MFIIRFLIMRGEMCMLHKEIKGTLYFVHMNTGPILPRYRDLFLESDIHFFCSSIAIPGPPHFAKLPYVCLNTFVLSKTQDCSHH